MPTVDTRASRRLQSSWEIERGADVVIGLVELAGDGFWARYTNSVAAERVAGETARGLMAYTTANLAIRREAFNRVHGFAPEYGKYGFEDKDLLIRLDRAGVRATVREDIRVSHDDDFKLAAVCRKAEESGRFSAQVFRDRFPDEYRQLPYARCDATVATGMGILTPLAVPIQHLAKFIAAAVLRLPTAFFQLQQSAVRVAICAAYFRGTTERSRLAR